MFYVFEESLEGLPGTHCVFDFEGPTKTRRRTQYMFCVFESLRKVDLVLLVYLRGQ